MKYQIVFSKQAKKDIDVMPSKLKEKLKKVLLNVISKNPYLGKKLLGALEGNYSYRLNIKDRIIYSISEKEKCVYVKRTRTHYGD